MHDGQIFKIPTKKLPLVFLGDLLLLSFSLAGEDLEDFTGEFHVGTYWSLVSAAAGMNVKAER